MMQLVKNVDFGIQIANNQLKNTLQNQIKCGEDKIYSTVQEVRRF